METMGTVRAYFAFFGLMGVIVAISRIPEGGKASWLAGVGLFLSLSYLCVGLVLPPLIRRSAGLVSFLLIAKLLHSLLTVVHRIFTEGVKDSWVGEISQMSLGVFLTWYVLNNVQSLAAEGPPHDLAKRE
jgi:hypothetical protein